MQYGGMGSAIANEIVKGFYYEGKLKIYRKQPTAQNIAEICQQYFQSFIAIEILPQHLCKLFEIFF